MLKLFSVGLFSGAGKTNFQKTYLKANINNKHVNNENINPPEENFVETKKISWEIEKKSNNAADIKKRLEETSVFLANEEFIVKIKIDQVQKGNCIFLECHIEEGELSFKNYERVKEILRNRLTDILTDFILDCWEDTVIRKIIKKNYTYFSAGEHETLIANAKKALEEKCAVHGKDSFNVKKRRRIIWRALSEYLSGHHELVIDGFVNFRLKNYRQKLAVIIGKTADEYMVQEEYKEFIRVLRYFVDIQPPRVEEVHVVVNGNGTFKILDKSGKIINTQYLENIVTQKNSKKEIELITDKTAPAESVEYKSVKFKQIEFKPNDIISYEDALISVLITIAPNNIMVHNNSCLKDQEMLETIKSIFTDRVITCNSHEICEICEVCKTENKTEKLKTLENKDNKNEHRIETRIENTLINDNVEGKIEGESLTTR